MLPWRQTYTAHCTVGEDACTKKASFGGYWTNDSSTKMFGHGAEKGDLDEDGGSPRWKQRALYDAMRDAHVLFTWEFPLARVSVYDRVGEHSLGDILDQKVPAPPMLIRALQSQDMYLAGSFLMFLAFLTVIGVLISDIALTFLDPRIRLGKGSSK